VRLVDTPPAKTPRTVSTTCSPWKVTLLKVTHSDIAVPDGENVFARTNVGMVTGSGLLFDQPAPHVE
jgi:hypothetical protein